MADTPAFLVTIDAEGDNIWAKSATVTTRNAAFLPRFQELCEKFRLKPTYLTNYEMAKSGNFVEFARDCLARQTAEIGMHLHAWNTPPHVALDCAFPEALPYLIEYPEDAMVRKIQYMTRLLEDTFAVPITSHRAGRWAFDQAYARCLAEMGYRCDCSVTPHVDWGTAKGLPSGAGGSDYTACSEAPYFFDIGEMSAAGGLSILEVPVTIRDPLPMALRTTIKRPVAGFARKVIRRFAPLAWLRPNGRNLESMIALTANAPGSTAGYSEFMLHSSEFMPGGSPTFDTKEKVEVLYRHLQELFSHVAQRYVGRTLSEFARDHAEVL